ncbi:hypothetical protein CR513_53702, partial [Mucuna pruriens]
MDRSMIDAANGWALMDKTPAVVRHLISNMASNTQQFGIRGASQSRMVNEISAVDNLRLENQLTELTLLVRQLAVGQHQPSIAARVCAIYNSVEHPTDMCPILQETESDYPERVGAIGVTILARIESGIICISTIRTCPECTSRTSRFSTTDSTISGAIVPATATTENTRSSMNATIEDLKMQIGQLANIVSQLQLAGSSYLPSQTIPNPRGNASALTLRSGKALPQPASQQLPRSADVDFELEADSQAMQ